MASEAPPRAHVDVYLSYARADVVWAEDLGRELSKLGLRSFSDLNLETGDSWADRLKEALDRGGALVVLWSSAATESQGVRSEIAQFEAVSRASQERRIIPVVLGNSDLLGAAPSALSSRQAVFIGPDAYAAGPKAAAEEWRKAVTDIATAIQQVPAKTAPPSPATLGTFSNRAVRALTYASIMVGDAGSEPARLRTAALLGALRASASGGMTPTTGDVVRLVLKRQVGGRTADETLSAAAAAAGLNPIGDADTGAMPIEALATSNVGELVRDAVSMQRRSGATSVHLRHVLATGVHPAVPPEALGELRVTMLELRSEWRASIARTWPDESQEGWDEILQVASDKVEWVPDAPARRDLLNRTPLADMLARRLRRLSEGTHQNGVRDSASFLIHLDGRWGSGKSSILNFLKADLEGGELPWLVVEFNAWQQARLGPAWWALLTALRRRMLQDLGPVRRWRLRMADALHRGRATGAPYALAILVVLAVAAAVFLAVGPAKIGTAKPGEVAKTVAAVIGAVGAVWAGALLVGRFVLWDSPTGARLFEQSNRNPMTYLRDHFSWTIDQVGRPVVFFIDDLDRCEQAGVVELLDSIQTLVRDTGQVESSPGPFFVVAADGGWIRASYEDHYRDLAGAIAEPGQTLGWLFLDKLFQLTVRVPDLSGERQSSYMDRLLDADGYVDEDADERAAILAAIDRSRTQAEAQEAWGSASAAVRESVAPEAVAKLTDKDVEARTEHHLQKFASLLDRNPRRMKLFLNVYTAEIVTSGLEQHFPAADELALWTILRIRWPVLAKALSASPDLVECIRGTHDVPDGLADDVVDALDVKDLRPLVDFAHGGPLTPDRIERLIGRADVSEEAATSSRAG